MVSQLRHHLERGRGALGGVADPDGGGAADIGQGAGAAVGADGGLPQGQGGEVEVGGDDDVAPALQHRIPQRHWRRRKRDAVSLQLAHGSGDAVDRRRVLVHVQPACGAGGWGRVSGVQGQQWVQERWPDEATKVGGNPHPTPVKVRTGGVISKVLTAARYRSWPGAGVRQADPRVCVQVASCISTKVLVKSCKQRKHMYIRQ